MDKKTFEENLKYNEIAWDFKKFVEDSIVKTFDGVTYDEDRQTLKCDEEFYKRTGYSKISVSVTLPTDSYCALDMLVDLKAYDIHHKTTIKEAINLHFDALSEVPGDAGYHIIISDFEIWRRLKTMENLESEVCRLNQAYSDSGIKSRYDINKYINEFGGKFSITKNTGNDLRSKSINKNNRFLKIFDKFLKDTISEYIKSNKRDGKLIIDLV
jgi:hypothetical protein